MSTELEKPDQPVISLFLFRGSFCNCFAYLFIFEDEAGDEFYLESIAQEILLFSRLYMIRYDARECKIFFCESPSQSPFLFLFLRSLDCVNRTEAGSNRQRQNKWSHTSSWELRTGKCEKLTLVVAKSEREVFKFSSFVVIQDHHIPQDCMISKMFMTVT